MQWPLPLHYISNQQHNYEERYKAVTKSLKERFTELQLRYG
ncbi:hypothetical protein [Avibacterium avium]